MAGLAGGPPRAVPSDAVVAVASRVLPADLVQKLLLLSIFTLACSGAAALLAREPWFARLAAGVFYAWNPFVAERLIIGQWALLLGYAGLPWALRAVTTGTVASWRGAGRLGVALLPAIVGGFAAMTVTALVVLPAAILARPPGAPDTARPPAARPHRGRPRRGRPGERVRAGLAALGVLAVGSLPWLIPSLAARRVRRPGGRRRVRRPGGHPVRHPRQPGDARRDVERPGRARGVRRMVVGPVAGPRAGRGGRVRGVRGPAAPLAGTRGRRRGRDWSSRAWG